MEHRGDYVDVVGFEIDGENGPRQKLGISVRGSHVRILDNHVHHIATDPAMCDSNGGAGIVATHYYFGVDVEVSGNVVHHIGSRGCKYIQGIYMSTSGLVRNNVVYEIGNWGIHLWHDAHRLTIANNTIVKSGGGITVGGGGFYHISITGHVTVAKNIVFDNDKGIWEQGTNGPNNRYTNNLSWNNDRANYSVAPGHSGDVVGDPQFLDHANDDYRLKSTSPAIDRGAAMYAPAVDIDGTARPQGRGVDVGAYEHAGPR